MADYTLPYQTNDNLDYNFIAEKCEKLMTEMPAFDDRQHHMRSNETKGLNYYFQYVKKNLYLFAVIDMIPGLYEDQLTEKFGKFHDKIQVCARRHYKDRGNLTIQLTREMGRQMALLNPPRPADAKAIDLESGSYWLSNSTASTSTVDTDGGEPVVVTSGRTRMTMRRYLATEWTHFTGYMSSQYA